MQKGDFAVGADAEGQAVGAAAAGDIDLHGITVIKAAVVLEQAVVYQRQREELSAVGVAGEKEVGARRLDVPCTYRAVVQDYSCKRVFDSHFGYCALDAACMSSLAFSSATI